MHVGFVSQNVYPHDFETRLTKAAATLTHAGHEVTVFCRGAKGSNEYEELRGVRVFRLRASTLPVNPRWAFWLTRMLRREGVDVVIARDLRMAPATILAARRVAGGIPVIMDTSENHPAHVEALGKQRLSHYIIRNPRLVGALERWCVRRADEVWVVAEANRRRLQGVVRDGTKIRLIRNVPDLDEVPAPLPRPSSSTLRLVYLGILDNLRGLDMLLETLTKTRYAELTLVGDGSERTMLEGMARRLGIGDRVTFRGWVSGPRRFEALWGADVGVIPHRVNYLTQTTEPNKLFDYMLCALPVLSTPLEPVAEVLKAERCGRVAEYGAEAWAQAIMAIAADARERAAMGERGREAVLSRYNWQQESQKVLAALEELV